MKKRTRMAVIGVFILMSCALLFTIDEAHASVFYGTVVAT
jgi:hypothetical protein